MRTASVACGDAEGSESSSGRRIIRFRPAIGTDYVRSENPAVLHRKETLLRQDDPLRAKFERLTRQEERAGLLEETATIGTRSGRADRLHSMGYA